MRVTPRGGMRRHGIQHPVMCWFHHNNALLWQVAATDCHPRLSELVIALGIENEELVLLLLRKILGSPCERIDNVDV